MLYRIISALLCLRQFKAALLYVSLKYSKENPLGFLVNFLQMEDLLNLENLIKIISKLWRSLLVVHKDSLEKHHQPPTIWKKSAYIVFFTGRDGKSYQLEAV